MCRKLNALLVLFEQNFDRAYYFWEILQIQTIDEL